MPRNAARELEAHPAYGLRVDQCITLEEELEPLIAAGKAADPSVDAAAVVVRWLRTAQEELSAAAAASIAAEPAADWESLKNEGNALLKQKDWEAAIGKYSAALSCARTRTVGTCALQRSAPPTWRSRTCGSQAIRRSA